jgi:hypothetical protein
MLSLCLERDRRSCQKQRKSSRYDICTHAAATQGYGDVMALSYKLGALGALLLVTAVGCSSSGADSGTSADEVNSGANTDVQVISAKSYGTIQWDTGGFQGFDAKKCKFSDRRPSTSSQYTSTAKADCTDALIAKLGASVNRYVEPIAWIREGANGSLDYSSFRHWCGQVEVVVAVKAAAWDAQSFKGIGFYGNASPINDGDNTRVYYEKNDSRLTRIGEATLKNEGHQKVYLYKFAGAGPCEANGTGDNPGGAIELKPFVTFAPDHERWESVQANHRVGYHQSWDRRGDLLD